MLQLVVFSIICASSSGASLPFPLPLAEIPPVPISCAGDECMNCRISTVPLQDVFDQITAISSDADPFDVQEILIGFREMRFNRLEPLRDALPTVDSFISASGGRIFTVCKSGNNWRMRESNKCSGFPSSSLRWSFREGGMEVRQVRIIHSLGTSSSSPDGGKLEAKMVGSEATIEIGTVACSAVSLRIEPETSFDSLCGVALQSNSSEAATITSELINSALVYDINADSWAFEQTLAGQKIFICVTVEQEQYPLWYFSIDDCENFRSYPESQPFAFRGTIGPAYAQFQVDNRIPPYGPVNVAPAAISAELQVGIIHPFAWDKVPPDQLSDCGQGYGFSVNEGSCSRCENGKYSDKESCDACIFCPLGFDSSDDRAQCEPFCSEAGRGFEITGRDCPCQLCSPGKFSFTGQSFCEECPAGTAVGVERYPELRWFGFGGGSPDTLDSSVTLGNFGDPALSSQNTCLDTNGFQNQATDSFGDGCSWYEPLYRLQACGSYDDDDFLAGTMCCSCGGGYISRLCFDNEGSAADENGNDCTFRDADASDCGMFDTEDFRSSDMCCACGGGLSSGFTDAGLDFDGVDDYVELPTWRTGPAMSFEIFLRVDESDDGSRMQLINFYDEGGALTATDGMLTENSIGIKLKREVDNIDIFVEVFDGKRQIRGTSATIRGCGAWIHLIVTINAVGIQIFDSGELLEAIEDFTTDPEVALPEKQRARHRLGSSLDNNVRTFRGTIRYVAVYEQSLQPRHSAVTGVIGLAGATTSSVCQSDPSCPAGFYSRSDDLVPTVGLCAKIQAGYYSSKPGSTSIVGDGRCNAGHWCAEGSTNSAQNICYNGFHCPPGSSNPRGNGPCNPDVDFITHYCVAGEPREQILSSGSGQACAYRTDMPANWPACWYNGEPCDILALPSGYNMVEPSLSEPVLQTANAVAECGRLSLNVNEITKNAVKPNPSRAQFSIRNDGELPIAWRLVFPDGKPKWLTFLSADFDGSDLMLDAGDEVKIEVELISASTQGGQFLTSLEFKYRQAWRLKPVNWESSFFELTFNVLDNANVLLLPGEIDFEAVPINSTEQSSIVLYNLQPGPFNWRARTIYATDERDEAPKWLSLSPTEGRLPGIQCNGQGETATEVNVTVSTIPFIEVNTTGSKRASIEFRVEPEDQSLESFDLTVYVELDLVPGPALSANSMLGWKSNAGNHQWGPLRLPSETIVISPRDAFGFASDQALDALSAFEVSWRLVSGGCAANDQYCNNSASVALDSYGGGLGFSYDVMLPLNGTYEFSATNEGGIHISGSPQNYTFFPEVCEGDNRIPTPGTGLNCVCEPGYGVSVSGACVACKAGSPWVSFEDGCVQCQAGFFGNTTDKCEKCSAGTYTTNRGQTTCINCATGKAQEKDGSQSCSSCEEGKVASMAGQSRCDACESGKQAYNGMECVKCLPGFFQDAPEQKECKKCAAGSISADAGEAECTRCPAGKFETANGTICVECAEGSAQPFGGQSECPQCATGSYAANSTACLECALGSIAFTNGSTACVLCSAGKRENGLRTACDDCTAGYYQDVAGQTACVSCIEGFVAAETGARTCSSCDVGSLENGTRTSCAPCVAGKRGLVEGGRSVCVSCSEGEYASEVGSVTCDLCDKGRVAMSNRTGCVDCPRGTFLADSKGCKPCEGGFVTLSSAQTECIRCDAGRVASEDHNQCLSCEAGKEASNDNIECTMCGPGSFRDAATFLDCQPCERGRYQPGPGKEFCIDCEIGRFQSKGNEVECEDCPDGFVAETPGLTACQSCMDRTLPGTVRIERISDPNHVTCIRCSESEIEFNNSCVCNDDHYISKDEASLVKCMPCPTGADCTFCPEGGSCANLLKSRLVEGVNVADLPLPKAGYFVPAWDSLLFVECRNKEACTVNGTYGSVGGVCGDGHVGPLCAPGYMRAVAGSSCVECHDQTMQTLIFVLCLTFGIVLAFGLIRTTILTAGNPSRIEVQILKILASYLQLVAMVRSFPLAWPPMIISMYQAFDFASSAGESAFSSIECLNDQVGSDGLSPFIVSATLLLAVPLLGALVSAAFWSGLKLFRKVNHIPDPPPAEGTDLSIYPYVNGFVVTNIILLFLLHPTLTRTGLRFFTCSGEDMGGPSFLEADFTVECWQGEHLRWALTVGVLLLGLYAFGIPLLSLKLLKRAKDEGLRSWRPVLGFLFNGFKPKYYYWEIIILSRKVIFAFVSVLLRPVGVDLQAYAGLGVISIAMMLQLRFEPYDEPNINRLELVGLIVSYTTVFSGLFLFSENTGDLFRILVSITIVAINSAFIFYVAFSVRGIFSTMREQLKSSDISKRISRAFSTRSITTKREGGITREDNEGGIQMTNANPLGLARPGNARDEVDEDIIESGREETEPDTQ